MSTQSVPELTAPQATAPLPTPVYVTAAPTSLLAIFSLILGLMAGPGMLALGLGIIAAIAAVVCGHLARSRIRAAQQGALGGDTLARVGLVFGYFWIGVFVLVTMFIGGSISRYM